MIGKMYIKALLIVLSGGLLLAGCSDPSASPTSEEATSDEPSSEGTEAEAPQGGDPVAEAPSVEAEADDEAPTEEELPIAEDFADEAEEAISEENYGAQLEALATEIEADIAAGGTAEDG